MLEYERRRHGYRQAARRIVAAERDHRTDAQLGVTLTFVAGAVNAGGFLVVGQYTSHMSGIVSAMADHLALGLFDLVLAGLAAFAGFISGAACSAVLINWGRRHTVGSPFVLPITLEGLLLLVFGLAAELTSRPHMTEALAIPLLCFIMGLQNATVTKVAGARMRTTHVTGIVTDIGIEVGKYFYERLTRGTERHGVAVLADRAKLGLLASLLIAFIVGGVTGAMGFSLVGPIFAVFLALILAGLVVPSLEDIIRLRRRKRTEPT